MVRKLNSLEVSIYLLFQNLNAVDTICSDKTGVLTNDRMELKMIWNKNYFHIDPNA
jgi:magnesium-transporting ATPase (P-type)